MLYRLDPKTHALDPLAPTHAAVEGLKEKDIESALASSPQSLFRSRSASSADSPVLVLRTSQPGVRMADVIALDAQGRLIIVECKRRHADRDALSQLLDYASEYAMGAYERLSKHWAAGQGRGTGQTLLAAFQEFADDTTVTEDMIGSEHVLVVVAAGKGRGFARIADYLKAKGVPVEFVEVHLYKRNSGDLYMEVEAIDLDPEQLEDRVAEKAERVWMVNTDETHSPGSTATVLQAGVAAIWGYPDYGKTLQKGARAGDVIYAYKNGVGIVARGVVEDGEVYQAEPGDSVFPQCKDGNEWHLRVAWETVPDGLKRVSNSEARKRAGSGLPVRNTFCRLWNGAVRALLAERWTPVEV